MQTPKAGQLKLNGKDMALQILMTWDFFLKASTTWNLKNYSAWRKFLLLVGISFAHHTFRILRRQSFSKKISKLIICAAPSLFWSLSSNQLTAHVNIPLPLKQYLSEFLLHFGQIKEQRSKVSEYWKASCLVDLAIYWAQILCTAGLGWARLSLIYSLFFPQSLSGWAAEPRASLRGCGPNMMICSQIAASGLIFLEKECWFCQITKLTRGAPGAK